MNLIAPPDHAGVPDILRRECLRLVAEAREPGGVPATLPVSLTAKPR